LNVELLRQVPLLSDLPKTEIDYLVSTLQVVEVEPGAVLFRESESGESLYIVIEGSLEVIIGLGSQDEKVLANLGRGEFIGEMSLVIPGGLRTASVRACGPARLWLMTRTDFDGLLNRRPTLAYAIVQTLSKRLDATNTAAFRDLQEKNRQLQKAYDELKAAQDQIIEKERLERELQVAAEIQISILPQELPRVTGFDFGALMVPARMVGGDFYDVFSISNDRIGIVIGDVADKGVPSAIFMARTHALIASEAAHGGSPGYVLQRVNRHLIQLKQSDLFVTVLFGVLYHESGEFNFARAGHEMPVLVTSGGKVEALSRKPGQAIGILAEPVFDEKKITIPPGGMLVCYTDGVTDSRNPLGESFGRDRLQDALISLSGQSAQTVCNQILQRLKAHQAEAFQDDDITLLAIRSTCLC
jgi:sigma-B regulation protein RsbU (phosphoserine phosphatase)